MTETSEEPANHTLLILRRLESKIDSISSKQDELSLEQAAIARKLDKLTIEVLGVKGRVRKVEEAVETIARVMSAEA
jgi:predicted  nucleic acid-binding Zn-ribbon protein